MMMSTAVMGVMTMVVGGSCRTVMVTVLMILMIEALRRVAAALTPRLRSLTSLSKQIPREANTYRKALSKPQESCR